MYICCPSTCVYMFLIRGAVLWSQRGAKRSTFTAGAMWNPFLCANLFFCSVNAAITIASVPVRNHSRPRKGHAAGSTMSPRAPKGRHGRGHRKSRMHQDRLLPTLCPPPFCRNLVSDYIKGPSCDFCGKSAVFFGLVLKAEAAPQGSRCMVASRRQVRPCSFASVKR